MRFTSEGIEWILLPSHDIALELSFYENILGLKPERMGKAKNDPFLEEYAILKAPNGMIIELVKPKQEYVEMFSYPVFCYTVESLLAKADLLRSQNVQIIGDIVDTGEGWGWFYTRNPSGILFQLQGPLPLA
jgi:predicted enzyme related to lactoylglutathione lyase